MPSINSLLRATLLTLLPAFCFAIDPSSKLPISIESDQASLDDQNGTSTYTGNVIISQGLSRLEADNISVKATNRSITTIQASGQPAHFVQQVSADSPNTHGYGSSITYIAKDNLLRFSGQAKLVQQDNSFSGEEIEYDIVRRAIRAKGDQTQGSRVKIHYYPNAETASENTEVPLIKGSPENENKLPLEPAPNAESGAEQKQ
ncbi:MULTISPECIES: lipopolysaccharide transport periplasmic protein LptA [unclassified Oleiphilus]|jgi:lipopolysaccharide export system protein LptA|nr:MULTISPECIES: lipopolysaccharide transport periplasmic protein LptA [unclassified Oleiphilus]KZY40767.1 hypothetical protein A3732_19380 [Oleiphilus sp. HI0050]KZY77551.1 hypothetical protein A3740_10165 [Oleiphilus sp. HI0068]KZY80896.1 hypothetical protein A3741_05165 [Oleiphilus sp. HI0069]KZZ13238.1 hypothetical protein A3749_05870 [Oleiphilus sp. HI0078]KZZ27641.1 hypothetical protein A3752_00420 [Oleiphilus sp. HI0081]